MISFEYGEGGAIVKENVINDEGKDKEKKTEKQRQTQQKKSLGKNPDSHLSVDAGSDAGILKVNLPNYTDYSQRTLTVYHLSGIQQTSLTLNDAFSTIDLRHLPRGTYVAVLTLDGERETKKICLKTSWHIKLYDNLSSEKKVYPLFGEGGRKPYLCREMKRLVYIFVLLFLLSACTDDRRVLSLLDRAEALMEAAPDSASRLLHAADSAIARQSEPTRMRHAILLAEANNKLYLPLPSDTIFQEVVDYYDRHGSPNQQLLAHYLLGCIYRDRNEAPQALQCYYDAIEKADTLSEDCDYTTLYKVYGQMADVLHNQVMPEDEIEAQKQYSKWALKAGNTYEYIRGVELMVRPYTLMGDTANILNSEKQARELYQKFGYKEAMARAHPMTISIYIAQEHYDKAKQLMDIFEKESGLFDKDGNIVSGREGYYESKGMYYLGTGRLDSAEFYFKWLLNHQYSYNGYRGLMRVKMEKGMADSVIFYAKNYEKSLDTLVTDIHAEATRQALGMYNYSRHQKIAAQKTAEAERQKNTFYIISLLVILAGLILYHLYARAKARRMAQAQLLTQRLATMSSLYRKTKEELDNIDKDLSAYKVQKQGELNELQQQLSQFQKEHGDFKQIEKFEALKQSPIVETLNERLKPTTKSSILTEKEWDALIDTFWQYMPSLTFFLDNKQTLSPLELRIAILTRLNFRSDDIALLLNTSKQHVSNLKGSANKKLFSDGSARTFFQNLCKI